MWHKKYSFRCFKLLSNTERNAHLFNPRYKKKKDFQQLIDSPYHNKKLIIATQFLWKMLKYKQCENHKHVFSHSFKLLRKSGTFQHIFYHLALYGFEFT